MADDRMVFMRSEQASRNDRTGEGQGVLCRLSMGLEAARQARDARSRGESCIMADDGAVAGGCGDGKAQDGQVDEYELGKSCCKQSTVGEQT